VLRGAKADLSLKTAEGEDCFDIAFRRNVAQEVLDILNAV
jgi:hypothetical protein